MTSYEHTLTERGIRPTAIRLLVLKALDKADGEALSLSALEGRLQTVDKSSIFRALTLFLQHHLVHEVEDGTGQSKYARCEDTCHCGEESDEAMLDLHTHFYCEHCRRTLCLKSLPVPQVPLPEGFRIRSAGYVLKGICADCARRGANLRVPRPEGEAESGE
ncbi:MAG: Fur family transcriptional regulator [Alloprevotella sp.]